MNSPEVARDVLAAMPIAESMQRELIRRHHVAPEALEANIIAHREVLSRQLGHMGLVLQEFPEAFAASAQKLEHDTAVVNELLRKLGPTNSLRTEEGYDAGLDFGHMIRLLERDYEAVPEGERRPEQRATEGILREGLALMWRPRTPVEFEGEHPGFLFDLEDPNVFDDESLQLSAADRWKIIGAQLSDEAADVFEGIYRSKTAGFDERLAARCRMVDMRIRSLRIQASMTGADREELYGEIDVLHAKYMAQIEGVWQKPEPRGIRNGLLYELTVVAQERHRLIAAGELNRWVRLAMPWEDRQHQSIRPIQNADGIAILFASDVIEEDMDGNFVQGYQVKSATEEEYREREEKREKTGRELRYSDRVTLRLKS